MIERSKVRSIDSSTATNTPVICNNTRFHYKSDREGQIVFKKQLQAEASGATPDLVQEYLTRKVYDEGSYYDPQYNIMTMDPVGDNNPGYLK